MARTDLKILSTNAGTGQKMTTTISHINPNANSSLLRQLGTKLNSMTTNNYAETNRVQTINVDTEEVVLPKKTLQLTAGTWITNRQDYYACTISNIAGRQVAAAGFITDSNTPTLTTMSGNELQVYNKSQKVNVKVIAAGNDEYESSVLEISTPL